MSVRSESPAAVLRGLRTGRGSAATAARRSVRVTVAACAGFYSCLYGLHQPVTATYALFAAVSMAGLSRIPGSGRQRAAVIARVLPLAWLLVSAGSLLAVRTWAAVAGMLVIGFWLAFAAVGGPRLAGAGPGLQLLYILPCFPPFVPQELGERLGGATLGLALLIAAESLLLPDPATPGYRQLLADAAEAAGDCAGELARDPWTLGAGARERARAASEALRPSRVAEAERPAGPGVRQRALAHAGGAARQLLARLQDLPAAGPPGTRPGEPSLGLLAEVSAGGVAAGAVLRGGAASVDASAVDASAVDASAVDASALETRLVQYRRGRVGRAGGRPAVLLRQSALIEAAVSALTLLHATELALSGRTDQPADGPFWYARQSTWQLWRHRLAGHLSRRSVYFQNAVRLSLGLAAARAVAGVVSLPHGFWAMLAALTLTRSTTAQTRTTVRQALTGTMAGALVAAALLVLVGHHTTVYAAALPPLMLATFCLGPLLGVGWAQALFTLVVSTVFAQLAPAGWQLAEARILDVLTGSLIGLLCGLLAWPRGGHDELRRATRALLAAIAASVTTTAASVTSGDTRQPPAPITVQHALLLAESSYAQAQCEPAGARSGRLDWQAALLAGHHAMNGAQRLLDHHDPPGTPGLGPLAGHWLQDQAAQVAGRYLLLAEELDRADAARPIDPAPAPAFAYADTPAAALPLLFDTGAWLQGLTNDLRRITPAAPP
ncbi:MULTISPECIES: FUSC family protein [unclassified Kitasatospora]|uniref:FUSC family protein n=1 Tax=unclassified Kitasatospora TaxID=2633591 RepID=UPI002474AFEC|nr:FUSC family protein [Kitasatospora sp. MAP12-44]